MSRWIDADAVESTLQEMEMITAMSHIELGEEDDDIGEISMPMFTVRNIMKTTPSIDFIRCAECKFWSKNTQFCHMFSTRFTAQRMLPNDFCSLGVKKESE